MSHRNNNGLDGRYRDLDGEIRHKNGSTKIGTLREMYGENLAEGYRSDMKLDTLLERERANSLTELVRRPK